MSESSRTGNASNRDKSKLKRKFHAQFGPASVDGLLSTGLEDETFTYLWSVKDFTALAAREEYIFSPGFKMDLRNGRSWRMVISPKKKYVGDETEYLELSLNVGNILAVSPELKPFKARCHFSILDTDGYPFVPKPEKLEYHDFSAGAQDFTESRFHRFDVIDKESSRLLSNDTLKIHVSVWVQATTQSTHKSRKVDAKIATRRRLAELSADFSDMLKNPRYTDFKISTATKTFLVHKSVLSVRSSVFRTMLETGLSETNENIVEIADFDEFVVKAMLEYIYTGDTKDLLMMPGDLFQIAEKYDLIGLKKSCEYVLYSNLTAENAADVFMLANTFNGPLLKHLTEDFIRKHKNDVVATEAYQKLFKSKPSLFVDIFTKESTIPEKQTP